MFGSQRAGTSSLHAYLTAHPALVPAYVKEVHYFDRNFDKGVAWYRSHFPTLAYKRQVGSKTGMATIVGGATPGYIFHPHAPRRVAQLLPDVKLVALLRNPVDRAYSNFWRRRAQGLEVLDSFEEAVAKEPERLEKELDKMLADDSYAGTSRRIHSYLTRASTRTSWRRGCGCFLGNDSTSRAAKTSSPIPLWS